MPWIEVIDEKEASGNLKEIVELSHSKNLFYK